MIISGGTIEELLMQFWATQGQQGAMITREAATRLSSYTRRTMLEHLERAGDNWTVHTPAHNDISTSTQTSAGGYESGSDSGASDWTTNETKIDEVTGEARAVKSASGVCIDTGDD